MSRLRSDTRSFLVTCAALVLAAQIPVSVALAQNVSFKGAPNSPVAVGSGPASVAVGDFNNDGKLDLAIANANDNTVSVLLGRGDGTFSPAHPFKVNRNPFPTVCIPTCSCVT